MSEKLLTGVGFALLVLLGVTVYRMEPTTRQAIWQGIWRTTAWLVFAGALPWTARFFVRRLLAVGSNWAGIATIGGFVLVDAIVGAYLMRGLPSSGGAWLAALAALGVVGTYNYLVTEYLAEQAGG